MKKNLLVLSAAILMTGALASCGGSDKPKDSTSNSGDSTSVVTPGSDDNKDSTNPESTTPTKEVGDLNFGTGYVTGVKGETNKSGAYSYTFTATVFSAAFGKDGKILSARGDVTQVTYTIDDVTDSKGVTAKGAKIAAGSGDLSKNELGTKYGMVNYGGSSLEFYEQIEAFAKSTVGKTVAELENSEEAVTGVSVGTDDFVGALKMAYEKSVKVDAPTTTLKTGVGMKNGSKDNSGAVYYCGSLTDGEKVLAQYVDCLAFTPVAGETEITLKNENYTEKAEEGQAIKSKRDLGFDYGMSKVTKRSEYFEQCEALDAYIAGKTLTAVAAINDNNRVDAEDLETDKIVSGLTVSANGLVGASKEAADYSTKDVYTANPHVAA